MKVLIEAPFKVKSDDKSEIESLVQKLEKYHDNITLAEVYFKMDEKSKTDAVLAEVQLHVPGPVVFASGTDPNFIAALSGAVDKAKRQIQKSKSMNKDY